MTDPYAETDTWPNPPASQQPARPTTLAASEAPRVLGEGSDAQEAREAAYARACGAHSWHATTERFRQTTRAVMAVADAERNEAYARGYQAAREHWKARAESAEAEVERMRGPFRCCEHCKDDVIHDVEPNQHELSCQLCDDRLTRRAESAERARDAALAEVTGLRDRLGRVAEKWERENRRPDGPSDQVAAGVWAATRSDVQQLRAALAVPVTGDTDDASPTAEDAPRPRRYDQCDETCTTDCGHCKGAASPTEQATEGGA